jgi:D-3-phosphoglycerate dehydrogenase
VSRIIVTDIAWPNLDIELRLAREEGHEVQLAESDDDLLGQAPVADAILTCFRRVPAEVLDRATRCVTVARYGVGIDNIDVTRATELGMVVSNVPAFCTEEVADHTLLLALASLRNLERSVDVVRSGGWITEFRRQPRRLRGLKFGIIGFGAIGQAVADRARVFGFDILVASRSLTVGDTILASRGIRVVDQSTLLAESDVVSLHLALNSETRHTIGATELASMKPGALLINVSRGGLIDTDALPSVVGSGRLSVALDVTDPEPLPPGHWLRESPEAIVTPHVAFVSDGALIELVTTATTNAIAALGGRPPLSVVNPEVFGSSALRIPQLATARSSTRQFPNALEGESRES